MNIYIGSDHAGYDLKRQIAHYLGDWGYHFEDVGCEGEESCDYPVYGKLVGERVAADPGSRGIVVCGTGIGISIAANKVPGIRAGVGTTVELTRMAREHNGINVLALGGRDGQVDEPIEVVRAFLTTEEDPAERHVRRRAMLG